MNAISNYFELFICFRIDDMMISIPGDTGINGLNKLVNHLLVLKEPVTFLFEHQQTSTIINKKLALFCKSKNLSSEDELHLKFFPSKSPPETNISQNVSKDWLSCISCIDNYIFTGCYDGSIEIFCCIKQKVKSEIKNQLHNQPIKAISTIKLNEEVVLIATGSRNGQLKLSSFNLKSKTLSEKYMLNAHTNSIECIALYLDNETDDFLLSCGSWDKNISICKLSLEELINICTKESSSLVELTAEYVISEHNDKISCLKFIKLKSENFQNSIYLCSASNDLTLKLYDETYQSILNINCRKVPLAIDFCIETQLLVTSHVDSCLRIWNLHTESEIFLKQTLRSREIQSFMSCLTVINKMIYSFDYQGNLYVWDLRSSLPIHVLKKVHEGKAFGISYNEKNKTVFSVGSDAFLRQHSLTLK